ncbi:hypothetical protein [Agathobacter rectalis]|uniref:hypothetical protein n=1 Tax=Agathobacter rectalis TaxID=39491 RepID=UPI000E4878EC|nr:hypothetical protein [Agathobacter rectalis]RGR59550.1 hypothetical protein DWY32_14700 [Agathobacter rectalis]RGS00504.1 hypothetical protein DWY15_14410 [Agathobacter rectalis]
MFNEILYKYKKFKKRKVPCSIIISIVFISVGIFLSIFSNYMCSQSWKKGTLVVALILIILPSICVIMVSKKISDEKSENYDSAKRYDEFKKFLNDNDIYTKDERQWLKEVCSVQLKENKNDEKYIMPFVSIIIVPTVLTIMDSLIKNNKGIDLHLFIGCTAILFIYYIAFRNMESEIKKLVNTNYYYLKRLRDDLENMEFYEMHTISENVNSSRVENYGEVDEIIISNRTKQFNKERRIKEDDKVECEIMKENLELKTKLTEFQNENDFLKRAVVFFAKEID